MTNEPVFPSWIEDEYDNICSSLPKDFRKKLDRCRREYKLLSEILDQFEDKEKVYKVYEISVEKLYPYFSDGVCAFHFLCECWIGYFHYRHIYKIKGYFDGLTHSLEIGNWVVGFSCLRCLMEESLHFDYFLSRVEKKVSKIDKLLKNEEKNINRRKKSPSDSWLQNFMQCQKDVVSLTSKAVEGSDFNWEKYVEMYYNNTDQKGSENERGIENVDRKTHIHKCIDESSKRHNKMFKDHYEALSEMCHPNFGSNTFVVEIIEDLVDNIGIINLSHKSTTHDIAVRFFILSCDPIVSTFSVERRNFEKCQYYYNMFRRCSKECRARSTERKAVIPEL